MNERFCKANGTPTTENPQLCVRCTQQLQWAAEGLISFIEQQLRVTVVQEGWSEKNYEHTYGFLWWILTTAKERYHTSVTTAHRLCGALEALALWQTEPPVVRWRKALEVCKQDSAMPHTPAVKPKEKVAVVIQEAPGQQLPVPIDFALDPILATPSKDPIATAKALEKLVGDKVPIKMIAQRLGYTKASMYNYLNLLKLDATVQAMMSPDIPRTSRLSIYAGILIARLPTHLHQEYAHRSLGRTTNLAELETLAKSYSKH